MTITLRPYQTKMADEIRDQFRQHRRVLGVLATGGGKTRIFSYITDSAAQKGRRVYIAAHREEICNQISGALSDLGVRHGRIQPGHTETIDMTQVAMIQTLARRIDRIPAPDLLVLDEAHHGIAGTWEAVTTAYSASRILGVTATPERRDGRGLGAAFDAMVVGPSMRDLIADGYLARYRYFNPPEQIDLSRVSTRAGDYAVDELGAAMDTATITGDAVTHYARHLSGRPAVVFAVTVAHAEHIAEQFRAAGWRAASVDGTLERTERRRRINGLGNGELQVLTSCDLISEGVDIPVVAGAILLRPTKSLGLYLQQVGRALRIKPDGGDAVILDHVGNRRHHGAPDDPREWTLDDIKRRRTAPPTTMCEECYRVFSSAQPGWKAEQSCENQNPAGCVLNAKEAASVPREGPGQVEGELVEAESGFELPNSISSFVRPWSGGLDIKTAPLKLLLPKVETLVQLTEIRKARKYHPQWVKHVWPNILARKAGPDIAFVTNEETRSDYKIVERDPISEHVDELAGLLA